MKLYYEIAGITVEMDSFGTVVDNAIPYRKNEINCADIIIHSYSDDVKMLIPGISDDMAEYLGTGVSFYKQLLKMNGIMLHSSAVVVNNKAYLFSADCGTGKSTHTQLWLKQFGDNAYILNDDKPALRLVNGKWYAFGTPWSGKNNISVNVGVRIGGIAMIERANHNEIQPYKDKTAIFEIFKQVNRPRDMEYRIKVLELIGRIMEDIPVWKLKCNMDPEAAIVAYEAMSGEKFSKE